ncbi:Enolase 1 [Labeo rohita]|uniref:Enolase 1 n=1 Tax=Labeo rohita TaxID=84645 RepID=A0ABQ8L9K1_LABRO|nr:Enolase 1 [Labeo rohita]
METDDPLSPSSPGRSTARSTDSEAHSAATSPHEMGSSFHLSSSEEVDMESVYEELLEVVTRAVSKLNIDWPAEEKTEQVRLEHLFTPCLCSRHTKPDLLKGLDEGEKVDLSELRKTADLAFRATKETTHAVGRSKAAMVAAERYLWLTLSDMKEKDRVFLLDAQLAPSSLFGNAVNSVVSRYQEARKQAAGHEQPQPCTSSSTAEGSPYQGRAGCTALHGVRLSSVPSGGQSATPARATGHNGLRRAHIPGLATRGPGCSSSLWGSLEQLVRQSPAVPPLQVSELAVQSRKLLPNVSAWVLLSCSLSQSAFTHLFLLCADFPAYFSLLVPGLFARLLCSVTVPSVCSHSHSSLFKPCLFIVVSCLVTLFTRILSSHPVACRCCLLPFGRRSPDRSAQASVSPLALLSGTANPSSFFSSIAKPLLASEPHSAFVFLKSNKILVFDQPLHLGPFAVTALPFDGVFPTLVGPEQALVMEQEVETLLRMEAIEGVWALQPVLHCSKEGWRAASYPRSTQTQSLSYEVEVRNAYGQASSVTNQEVPELAFRGKAYQYRVLPFGSALSPCTFMKCVDTAMVPLQLHRRLVDLSSINLPGRGVGFNHDAGTSVSCSELDVPRATVAKVKEGWSLTVKQFQQLLGLMAAAVNWIPFGLLHMRPLQWWLKSKGFSLMGNPLRMIKVT